jgi:hypothetical protein
MSKSKKKKPMMYTITETIHVCYQVVAMSEEEAQSHYRNLPSEEFTQLLEEAASNNYCDDEVSNEEEYDKDRYSYIDVTEKAQKHINKNLPEA